jgi:hypothetical protein
MAPIVLMPTPVALIALPFLLVAFVPGAADNHLETARVKAWGPARAALT